MAVDLTNILISKTEVVYQGVICVFTHISRLRDLDTNKVKFRVTLQDKVSVVEEDLDSTFPQSINTGVCDWDAIKDGVSSKPNSIKFIQQS